MSYRAIQRLREERESKLPPEEESSEEEDEGSAGGGGRSGFAAMMADESSDDSSASGGDDSDSDENNEEKADETLASSAKENEKETPVVEKGEPKEKTEDLDALLEEFKVHDVDTVEATTGEEQKASYFDILTSAMETRDLDVDYVMRTSLLGSNEDAVARSSNRRGRQASVFGPPRDNWPRPPHYVGGGIGMASYDEDSNPLPWPYSDMKEGDERCPGLDRWFKYTLSDSYQRDCGDYERVKASGDPNSLALFIAHHPFVVEALLQLSVVLYQTNQSQEGLSLLKRALYVFECASLNSFLRIERRVGFMDQEQPDNGLFFSALFRMVRVSHAAGLPRASLALSRFLLSLDPLRDPMGILLALDHFALLSNTGNNNRWLVDLVESDKVGLHYKDDTNIDGYQCSLIDLPNWAYSYALALYRINESDPLPESKEKADRAMKMALNRFPSVIEQLLARNEVDVTGRSFQADWPSVLAYSNDLSQQMLNEQSNAAAADPVVRACTAQSSELVARIFVQQNFKLWSSNQVVKWMYRNLKELKESEERVEVDPLSPALMRYARSDPSDYEDKFQTMPADANPLEPGLVAQALTVDVNRPRFMQRMHQGGGAMAGGLEFAANQQGTMLAGPPTEMIDPDWPLLEVFWRSALPWTHVEGVPPPRR